MYNLMMGFNNEISKQQHLPCFDDKGIGFYFTIKWNAAMVKDCFAQTVKLFGFWVDTKPTLDFTRHILHTACSLTRAASKPVACIMYQASSK